MKEALLAQLDSAYEYFGRSTSALAEEDSSFSPSDSVYTAAQQVAHAAQTIDWFMDGAFNPAGFDMDFEAHDRKAREVSSLNEVRARLSRSVEHARELVNSRSDEEWVRPWLSDRSWEDSRERWSSAGSRTTRLIIAAP